MHIINSLLLMLLILSSSVSARSLDVNFTNEDFRLAYAYGVGKNLVADLGFLYSDASGKFQDDELGFHAGLNVTSGNVRFGGRAFFIAPGDSEVLAVGFGGQGRLALSKRVGLGGHFYYAPDITSFLDAEGYHEYSIRLDFKMTPSAYIYVGYRNVKISVGDRDNKIEIDDDVMLGIKLFF